METQKSKTLAGIKWSFFNQLVTQISLFAVGIYLMNLLPPEEFGLLGMITVFTGALAVFSDFGLNASLIQKRIINREDKDTVYWLSLFLSIILALILFIGSYFIDDFYDEPRLTLLTQVLSFNFILQGIGNIHSVLYRKDLNFRILFFMRSGSIICSSGIAIWMAYRGYGVWTLIAQTLINSFVFTLLGFIFNEYRPKGLKIQKNIIREHLSFGLPVFGTRMATYASTNVDKLLIGKYISAYSLGIYSRAFTLITLPLHHFSQVLTQVMFSSFSLIQEDKAKIDEQQQLLTKILLYSITPFIGIIAIGAEPLILFLVGDTWKPSIPIIQILCLYVFFKVMTTLRSNVLWAVGNSRYELYFTIISSIILFAGQIIGVQYGIIGVAIGLTVSMFLTIFPSFAFTAKALNSNITNQLSNVLGPLFIFIMPTLVIFFLIPKSMIWMGVLIFTITFGLFIIIFEKQLMYKVINIFHKRS